MGFWRPDRFSGFDHIAIKKIIFVFLNTTLDGIQELLLVGLTEPYMLPGIETGPTTCKASASLPTFCTISQQPSDIFSGFFLKALLIGDCNLLLNF